MTEYMLVAKEKTYSQLNQCPMYRYTWIELETLEIWETTVDESFRNWHKKGWDQLSRGDTQYGIYTGLRKSSRTSKQGYGILTADSRPELLIPIESQDLACDVVLKLKEQTNG